MPHVILQWRMHPENKGIFRGEKEDECVTANTLWQSTAKWCWDRTNQLYQMVFIEMLLSTLHQSRSESGMYWDLGFQVRSWTRSSEQDFPWNCYICSIWPFPFEAVAFLHRWEGQKWCFYISDLVVVFAVDLLSNLYSCRSKFSQKANQVLTRILWLNYNIIFN